MNSGAYVDLRDAGDSKSSECSTILQSDKIFKRIAEQIKRNADEVKKVNAVFEFQIMLNGKVSNTWGKPSPRHNIVSALTIFIFFFQSLI